ncbi:MAG: prepilin-type N-terminal cleavage/methylation domain-containing protein [Oligoflexales bacterium]|nr:prepilin-type N-terminal cleavage/methylation domain-containing protein [Oligoflexales bacterium]
MNALRKLGLTSYLRKQKGFSLVELMVVVAIISVLAAIAIPRFRVFQARARQSEAKANLAHIFTLEQSYHADNDTYVDLAENNNCGETDGNEIGFVIPGGCSLNATSKTRYKYWVENSSTTDFEAHAQSGAGADNRVNVGCEADEWTMNATKTLAAVKDSIKECGNKAP